MTQRMIGGVSASLPAMALLLAVARPAETATCTIQPGGFFSVSHVPSAGDVPSPVPAANGLVIPVDVDEAAGTFVVRRETLPDFGFTSQGGGVGLRLAGPPVQGTIDAAGHVALQPWNIVTRFVGIDLPQAPAFTTASKSVENLGEEFGSSGTPLDFTTGILTLDGVDIIPSAPIVSEPVASEFKLTCRLDPIPDPTRLPPGSSLKGAGGKAKIGSAEKGDTLTFAGRLIPAGDARLDLAGRDAVLKLTDAAGQSAVMILARATALRAKGKKRAASGSDVKVLAGAKLAGDAAVPSAGTVTLIPVKKAVVARFRVQGLDLAGLAGPLGVELSVGNATARGSVTVKGGGKTRTLR